MLLSNLHIHESTWSYCKQLLRRLSQWCASQGGRVVHLGCFFGMEQLTLASAAGTQLLRNLVEFLCVEWPRSVELVLVACEHELHRDAATGTAHVFSPLSVLRACGPFVRVVTEPTPLDNLLLLPYAKTSVQLVRWIQQHTISGDEVELVCLCNDVSQSREDDDAETLWSGDAALAGAWQIVSGHRRAPSYLSASAGSPAVWQVGSPFQLDSGDLHPLTRRVLLHSSAGIAAHTVESDAPRYYTFADASDFLTRSCQLRRGDHVVEVKVWPNERQKDEAVKTMLQQLHNTGVNICEPIYCSHKRALPAVVTKPLAAQDDDDAQLEQSEDTAGASDADMLATICDDDDDDDGDSFYKKSVAAMTACLAAQWTALADKSPLKSMDVTSLQQKFASYFPSPSDPAWRDRPVLPHVRFHQVTLHNFINVRESQQTFKLGKGANLASQPAARTFHLQGDNGAGKTTLWQATAWATTGRCATGFADAAKLQNWVNDDAREEDPSAVASVQVELTLVGGTLASPTPLTIKRRITPDAAPPPGDSLHAVLRSATASLGVPLGETEDSCAVSRLLYLSMCQVAQRIVHWATNTTCRTDLDACAWRTHRFIRLTRDAVAKDLSTANTDHGECLKLQAACEKKCSELKKECKIQTDLRASARQVAATLLPEARLPTECSARTAQDRLDQLQSTLQGDGGVATAEAARCAANTHFRALQTIQIEMTALCATVDTAGCSSAQCVRQRALAKSNKVLSVTTAINNARRSCQVPLLDLESPHQAMQTVVQLLAAAGAHVTYCNNAVSTARASAEAQALQLAAKLGRVCTVLQQAEQADIKLAAAEAELQSASVKLQQAQVATSDAQAARTVLVELVASCHAFEAQTRTATFAELGVLATRILRDRFPELEAAIAMTLLDSGCCRLQASLRRRKLRDWCDDHVSLGEQDMLSLALGCALRRMLVLRLGLSSSVVSYDEVFSHVDVDKVPRLLSCIVDEAKWQVACTAKPVTVFVSEHDALASKMHRTQRNATTEQHFKPIELEQLRTQLTPQVA